MASSRTSSRRLCAFAALSVALVVVATSCSSQLREEEPAATEPDQSVMPDDDWSMGPDDLIAAYEASLEPLARSFGIDDPPDVDLVRFVTTDEWAAAQVDCLAQLGVQAQVGGQGGVVYEEVPSEQADTVNLAAYTCQAMYPADPRTLLTLPRIRAEMQYAHLVNTVLPCVRELGFEVSDPPTEQTWLEQYYTGGEEWDPYADVAATGVPEDLDAVYEACPHDAPELYPAIDG